MRNAGPPIYARESHGKANLGDHQLVLRLLVHVDAVVAAPEPVAHHQRLDVLAPRPVRKNLAEAPRDPRDDRLPELVRVVRRSRGSVQQHRERFRVEL